MTVQRAIEMLGIPTVLITTDPESSGLMRPPRAISPKGFHFGHSLGRAHHVELQKKILETALRQLVTPLEPGKVQIIEFEGY